MQGSPVLGLALPASGAALSAQRHVGSPGTSRAGREPQEWREQKWAVGELGVFQKPEDVWSMDTGDPQISQARERGTPESADFWDSCEAKLVIREKGSYMDSFEPQQPREQEHEYKFDPQ
ncbi:hypothetical protein DUI87_27399 [Hirundo rustica rustica]|uniref:Uncharacterized protein n=1 Tax=Hirundo rustica rustica TaxID=333673 RepID=A0A3M0JB49_HIRRU|nr:hypothetical protein DUI87_27399 [Hirundo rustica rustica]